MPKKYQTHFEIIFILLFGLVSQAWFKKDNLLIGVDTFLPLNLDNFLNEYFYIWSWKTAFGFADVVKLPFLFPLGILLKLYALSHLPFSILIFQRLLTYFLFAGSGLSVYSLFRTSFPQSSFFSRLIAALLYMFNFYTMFIFFALPYPLLFSYAFFPLVFALYIRWLKCPSGFLEPLALALVWFFFLTPSYMTPPYLVLHLFILALYSTFWVFWGKLRWARFKKVAWFNLLLLAFWLLLNSFWLLPFAFSIKEQLTVFRYTLSETIPTDLFTLNSVPVLEALRLRGYFGFTDSYKGEAFYPWFKFYENNPLFEVLSFAVPLLAFAWLLEGGRKNKRALFFSVFTLVFIGLVKGVNSPFGFLNKLMFSHPPLTTIFRSVYQRFTGYIALGIALLVGYTFDRLFKAKRAVLFLLFLMVFCGAYAWPIWSGKLFLSEGIFPSRNVRVPEYYLQAAEWLDGQSSNSNILLLPFNRLGLAMSLWDQGKDGYDGVELLPLLSKGRFAYGYFGGDLEGKLASGLISGKWSNARPLLPFNFRHILVKNDAHWEYIKGNGFWVGDNQDIITKSLSEITGIRKSDSFGKLDFYRVDDDYFLPHFYVPERMFYISGDFEVFSVAADSGIFGARPGLYLIEQGGIGELNTDVLGRTDGVLVGVGRPLVPSTSKTEWQERWTWPEAKVSPRSLGYLLVRLREWWRERRGDDVLRADTLFWHGLKRAEEIKKWGSEDEELFNSLISRYEKKVRAAIEILGTVPEEKRDERFRELVEKFLVYIERTEREIKGDDESLSVSYLEKFGGVNKKLRARIDEVAEPRCSKSERCYRVAVPEDGQYEVLIGRGDVEMFSVREMVIGEEKLGPVLDQDEESWVRFGKASLSAGTHILKFEVSEPGNLLPEKDSKDRPAFYEKIAEWEYGKKYKISFDYEIGSEEVSLFVKLAKKGSKGGGSVPVMSVGEIRGGSVEEARWKHFERVVEADYGVEEVALYLYTGAEKDLEMCKFKNVAVRRVLEPVAIMLKKVKNAESAKKPVPRVTFAKVSPTKYKVKVEGAKEPYSLVFNERFHEGWRLYKIQSSNRRPTLNLRRDQIVEAQNSYGGIVATYFDGDIREGTPRNIFWDSATFETWGKRSVDADHLPINAYASSWYIEPEDVGGAEDYELIVEFWPQRLIYIGLLISGVTLVGCFGYLIAVEGRRR